MIGQAMMGDSPLIVAIKRHSLEDGPGIRSVVFFKGCPLRCLFCHNPETQDPGMEIAFSPRECIRCGECAEVCTEGAIDLDFQGRIHRDRCARCGRCAGICPGKGLRSIGSFHPVENLAEILLRDIAFYRHSGGGVTLSGGECTLYPDYLESLLKLLKERGIHIVLETSGHFGYDTFRRKVLPHIDLVYYDIKFADTETHKRYVGKTNKGILENLRRLLVEREVEVNLRVPLIPGITATRENLSRIVDLLCEANADNVSLVPYNPMGLEMFASLGRPKPPLPAKFMKPDDESEIHTFFKTIITDKGKPRLAFANLANPGFHNQR